jgi:xylulose-5-phosphate/fructose-6-phosphate phosphoketolase
LIIASKVQIRTWLSLEEAKKHCQAGLSVWKWLGTDEGQNPDVVIVGCGNETNVEAIAATFILKRDLPSLRVRFVNVTDIMVISRRDHPNMLTDTEFDAIFTADKPVIFNFHGYPSVIQSLLFGRPNIERFHVVSKAF